MSNTAYAVATPVVDSASSGRRALRVCHLAYTFYENDNRVRRYADVMAEQGHEVEVIALRRRGQERAGRIGDVYVSRIQQRAVTEKSQLTYLVKLLLFLVRSLLLLGRRHVRQRYDVVHVHNVPDFLVFAALVPRLFGARIVLDIHDILPELYAGKFNSGSSSLLFKALLWLEKASCRFAHHVIVANDLWHDRLTARAVESGKCTTLLNYPDLQIFKPLSPDQKRRDGRFVMLYPGTLNHHQGLDIAIRAFASARDRMPAAELHIYGEGPARQELTALVTTYGLTDRIRILDPLPLETIALVIASADVGIVPKRADGFGNEAFSTKTLEFMACGVPVVVSRTRVDSHYFTDQLVRFFVPGSDTALADAMLSVYSTRFTNAAWVEAARQFAIRNSWQERMHDYLRLVDRLVAFPLKRAGASR